MTKQEGKNNSVKRATYKVLNVVFYVVIAFVYACAIWGIVCKLKGTEDFSFFGYKAYIIVSPSMSHVNEEHADFLKGHNEQMQVGDLVLTRKIKSEDELQLYSIVTYSDSDNKVIIHRIVEIRDTEDGKYYVTRGDANNTQDAPKRAERFTGIYVANLKILGKVVLFIQSLYGIVALAGCGFLFFVTEFFLQVHKEKVNYKIKTVYSTPPARIRRKH